MAIDHFLPRVAATASGLSAGVGCTEATGVARGRPWKIRARCCVFRGTSQLLSTSNTSLCSCKVRFCCFAEFLVCYVPLAMTKFGTHRHVRTATPFQESHQRPQLLIKDAKLPVALGPAFCVSEAIAQKCATTERTDPSGTQRTAADRPSSLPRPVTSATKAAVGAQKQKCREYDYSHSSSARKAYT